MRIEARYRLATNDLDLRLDAAPRGCIVATCFLGMISSPSLDLVIASSIWEARRGAVARGAGARVAESRAQSRQDDRSGRHTCFRGAATAARSPQHALTVRMQAPIGSWTRDGKRG